ncbi:MYG1 family protein [Bifidobacterium sp.]|uniref:MYG1 family protein n=1 Tax=Bifidobacterium sp. TaxID=41200 RepID=UPI0025C09E8E|nr:MYG1 family protein [Bifidobacterium sp.]MCH4209654.1 MYG1 family protein [Bifidobacterium sp.]MCI1225109.1 MYG1 family protein [Bifidobacterium sp.]
MLIATHNGKFHADDVFGVTLLTELYPDATVIRTRDPKRLAPADIVLDVGGVHDETTLRFDHHQNSGETRENGIRYSAFGLLWQHYGLRFCDNDRSVWHRIDLKLVQVIDAIDNGQDLYSVSDFGVQPLTVSDLIGWFNAMSTRGDEQDDEQFFVAVAFARQLLLRTREKTRDAVEGERVFLDAYKASRDKRYVILDRFVPHGHIAIKQPELLYVVFPDSTEGWRIQTVPTHDGTFEARMDLPKAWRGLANGELAAVTGVADSVFCHRTGFIAGTQSKEGIMELLRQALAQRVQPAAAQPAKSAEA